MLFFLWGDDSARKPPADDGSGKDIRPTPVPDSVWKRSSSDAFLFVRRWLCKEAVSGKNKVDKQEEGKLSPVWIRQERVFSLNWEWHLWKGDSDGSGPAAEQRNRQDDHNSLPACWGPWRKALASRRAAALERLRRQDMCCHTTLLFATYQNVLPSFSRSVVIARRKKRKRKRKSRRKRRWRCFRHRLRN